MSSKLCKCGAPLKQAISNSEQNPGRAYEACSVRTCKLSFRFLDEPEGQPANKKSKFFRYNSTNQLANASFPKPTVPDFGSNVGQPAVDFTKADYQPAEAESQQPNPFENKSTPGAFIAKMEKLIESNLELSNSIKMLAQEMNMANYTGTTNLMKTSRLFHELKNRLDALEERSDGLTIEEAVSEKGMDKSS